MSVKTWVARLWAKYRVKQIRKASFHAIEVQDKLFRYLVEVGKTTRFGKEHRFEKIQTSQAFQASVPVRDYEAFKPYFDEVQAGKPNITWKGKPLYLAKTSGTTSGTKYIPLSEEMMGYQVQGARDALLCYIFNSQKPDFLDGKMMFLSGSPQLDKNSAGLWVGRLSGISNHFVPAYLRTNQVPTFATNCIEDWEQKIAAIFQEVQHQDLRLISGIPPWVQMFFEYAEQQTQKKPIELWKNLQVFVQGGVDFKPYKPIFEKTLGKQVDIVEVFPASEGFFAIQDDYHREDLLLMPNYGVWYEFIPLEAYGQADAPRLTLSQVETGVHYAMIISTVAGLWAYDLGDTILFTSLKPYRIKVTGRTKHFISAFGEHVIQSEVNQAVQAACQATDATVNEFHVAPSITEQGSCHEWFIEFQKFPNDPNQFLQTLDHSLQTQNIYYKDLRTGNILTSPIIHSLPLNTCREYMKSIGKLGGQNKFPRLANHRNVASFLEKSILNTFLDK